MVFGRDPIANEMVLAIAPPSLSGYSYNNYNSLRAAPLYHTTSLVFGRDPIANEIVLAIAPPSLSGYLQQLQQFKERAPIPCHKFDLRS